MTGVFVGSFHFGAKRCIPVYRYTVHNFLPLAQQPLFFQRGQSPLNRAGADLIVIRNITDGAVITSLLVLRKTPDQAVNIQLGAFQVVVRDHPVRLHGIAFLFHVHGLSLSVKTAGHHCRRSRQNHPRHHSWRAGQPWTMRQSAVRPRRRQLLLRCRCPWSRQS